MSACLGEASWLEAGSLFLISGSLITGGGFSLLSKILVNSLVNRLKKEISSGFFD